MLEKIKETLLTLQEEIRDVNMSIRKMIVWTGVGVVVVLGGMLAKGFHWW